MAAAEGGEKKTKNYNIKQYKGLIDNISGIKEQVDRERTQAVEREKALQERISKGEAEAHVIQKELSVQLRCAGRSYQQLLGATRELTDQLREQEEEHKGQIAPLEKTIKDLKAAQKDVAKPWRDEVAKRDLKILKLQEAAADQEVRLREALAEPPKLIAKFEKEVIAQDEKSAVILKEVDYMREEMEKEKAKAAIELEAEKVRAHKAATEEYVRYQTLEAQSNLIKGPYEKQVKELELTIQGLQNQLDEVDYAPFEKQVKKKEAGYDKLIKDFGVKQKMNEVQLDKMRAGFDEVIKRMDKQIQDNEKIFEEKLRPWKDLVAKKDTKIEHLQTAITDFKAEEEKVRATEKVEKDLLKKELEAAKGGVDLLNSENTKLRRTVERFEELEANDNNPRNKIMRLEHLLNQTTEKCEAMLKHRDRELKEKTDMVMRLQRRVLEETENAVKLDLEWDKRVQVKEEGYDRLVAQLAFAEGQIIEERKRVDKGNDTIKKRDETIVRLQEEHTEELRIRLIDREELVSKISELEVQIEEACGFEDPPRQYWEALIDAFKERADERVRDLRVDIVRRDKARAEVEAEVKEVRAQFEQARLTWEDKERELEIIIRGRDRANTALKNEIEFINDSWEIKYNRLMGLFEKLQKKYDELVGPNGVSEAYRRCRDLKTENNELVREILELKEMLKKQKRQIRDLQLDIDMHMKETADLIAEKERGIAEMVGDMAKLQNRLREEQELRDRLVKELQEEKKDIVESFQQRIEQLEQLVESMRFTDRQELIDKIAVWKNAYARVCNERDELEDYYVEQVDLGQQQVKKMVEENTEIAEKVQDEKIKAQMEADAIEERWKGQKALWMLEKEKLEKALLKTQLERDMALKDAQRQLLLADSRTVDPEKDGLRAKIKEQQEQMKMIEAGIQRFIDDNNGLRAEIEVLNSKVEASADDFGPQIKWRDERYEAMVKEHEALKKILAVEMKKAQDTCKSIEEQVRKFPNPFEDELIELKDRYAQTQAGMLMMSRDNLRLKEEMIEYREEAANEKVSLERALELATTILKEVASLGALREMSKADMNNLESALGIDLDGDGIVG